MSTQVLLLIVSSWRRLNQPERPKSRLASKGGSLKHVSARLWEELSGDGGLSFSLVGEKQRFHIEKYCGPRDQISWLMQL